MGIQNKLLGRAQRFLVLASFVEASVRAPEAEDGENRGVPASPVYKHPQRGSG